MEVAMEDMWAVVEEMAVDVVEFLGAERDEKEVEWVMVGKRPSKRSERGCSGGYTRPDIDM